MVHLINKSTHGFRKDWMYCRTYNTVSMRRSNSDTHSKTLFFLSICPYGKHFSSLSELLGAQKGLQHALQRKCCAVKIKIVLSGGLR